MGKFKPFDKFEHLDSIAVCHEYIKLLEAELRKARADALEEAARVAERPGVYERRDVNNPYSMGRLDATAEIRALKGDP